MPTCPICGCSAKDNNHPNMLEMECIRCGKYSITIHALDYYNNRIEQLGPKISFWIQHHQGESIFNIDKLDLEKAIQSIELPKAKEQAENLILILGKNAQYPNTWVHTNSYNLTSQIGAKDTDGLDYIIDFLRDKNLILYSDNYPGVDLDFKLTIEGWEQYDQISKTILDSKIAFMAMQYGNDELDEIFKNILKPTLALTGFDLRRLDENPKAGIIDNRLRVEIRNARFLIVDLSSDNQGAYFEAGFAEGLGKPVIYICKEEKFKDTKTHFDTNHNLTLTWNKNNLDLFIEELKATIRNTIPTAAKMLDE